MKKFLILLLFAFGLTGAFAQNQKSFIGISLGPSFPVGDFANTDLSDENSGLAKVGGTLSLNYGYHLSQQFGLMAVIRGSVHGVDVDALKRQYATPDGIASSISFKTSTWKSAAAMVGIFEMLPLNASKNLFFVARGAIGVQRSQSPSTDITIAVSGLGTFTNHQDSYSATSLAYLLGLGLDFQLEKNLSLKFNADYTGANPKFQDPRAATYPQNNYTKLKQPINTVDLSLGLAFRFY